MRTSPTENLGAEEIVRLELHTGPYDVDFDTSATVIIKRIYGDSDDVYYSPKFINNVIRILHYDSNHLDAVSVDLTAREIINLDFPLISATDGTLELDSTTVVEGAFLEFGGDFAQWVEKSKEFSSSGRGVVVEFDIPRLSMGYGWTFYYDVTSAAVDYPDVHVIYENGIFTTDLSAANNKSVAGFVPNAREKGYIRVLVFDRAEIERVMIPPYWGGQTALGIFIEEKFILEYV